MNTQIKKISIVGVLSALAVILVILIRFPIFPAVPFLEYDPADIPIFFVTSILGPWYGLAMTVVVSVIQGITVSASSGIAGIFMHIVATGSFVLVEGLIMRHVKIKQAPSKAVSAIAFLSGIITMIAVMALWNLIVTPYFMNITVREILGIYKYIIGFNAIKASANGIIAFVLYSALMPVARKYVGMNKEQIN